MSKGIISQREVFIAMNYDNIQCFCEVLNNIICKGVVGSKE